MGSSPAVVAASLSAIEAEFASFSPYFLEIKNAAAEYNGGKNPIARAEFATLALDGITKAAQIANNCAQLINQTPLVSSAS